MTGKKIVLAIYPQIIAQSTIQGTNTINQWLKINEINTCAHQLIDIHLPEEKCICKPAGMNHFQKLLRTEWNNIHYDYQGTWWQPMQPKLQVTPRKLQHMLWWKHNERGPSFGLLSQKPVNPEWKKYKTGWFIVRGHLHHSYRFLFFFFSPFPCSLGMWDTEHNTLHMTCWHKIPECDIVLQMKV